MTPAARELVLVGTTAALLMAFSAQLRRSDQLPVLPPMLAFVAAPPPPAPPPVRWHAGMSVPHKTVDVPPAYPAAARVAHVEGAVLLDIVIDAQGRVQAVRVLRSIPALDQAAIDAVRQWRFTPTRVNGAAVPIAMNVTVTFSLSRG